MATLAIYQCTTVPNLTVGEFQFQAGWLSLDSVDDVIAFSLLLAADPVTAAKVTRIKISSVDVESSRIGVPFGNMILIPGPRGKDGADSTVPGPKGEDSIVPGPPGPVSTVPGPQGISAYQVWLNQGNVGSQADFLNSLKGANTGIGELRNGKNFIPANTSLGATPNDIFYELGAGGQPAQTPAGLSWTQIIDTRAGSSLVMSRVKFNNGPKPFTEQTAVNRGTGIPGPGFSSKTLAGDRIYIHGFYGGKDSDGTTSAFAHAGYITVTAETDNDGSNEQDTQIHIQPGAATRVAAVGRGNGIQINSRMQVAAPGPNRAPFSPGAQNDYGANFYVGPASADSPQMKMEPGPLAAMPVVGAVETDSKGRVFLTATRTLNGVATSVRERISVETVAGVTLAPDVGAGTGAAIDQISYGPNCVRFRLTIGANPTAGSAIVGGTYATAFESNSWVSVTPASVAAATGQPFASANTAGFSIIMAQAVTQGSKLSFIVFYQGN